MCLLAGLPMIINVTHSFLETHHRTKDVEGLRTSDEQLPIRCQHKQFASVGGLQELLRGHGDGQDHSKY